MKRTKQRLKRKWFLVSLFLIICTLCSCSQANIEDALQEVQDQAGNIINSTDEHVIGVKNGYPLAYPAITYGQAFSEFFSDSTWNYFKADTGEDVVEFTGRCIYQDTEVKARLQFVLSEDGKSFSQGALSFNDVPQSTFITSIMINKAFCTYAKRHQISVDEQDDESVMGTGTETQMGDEDLENTTNSLEEESLTNNTSDDSEGISLDNTEKDDESSELENDTSEYVISDSDTRRLKVREVKRLNKETRRLAKNEIYARHGRRFQDTALQKYFDSKSWYLGTIEPEDFDEHVFSKIEKENVRLLAKYENKK